MHLTVVTIFLLLSVIKAAIIFSEPFTDYSWQSRFAEHYSWDSHTPTGEKEHFKIVSFGGKQALNISLLYTDLTFEQGSPTLPRSELREHEYNIPNNVDLSVTWDWYLQKFKTGFWFCFLQLFMDSAPNVMLRWETDHYLLYTADGHAQLQGDIASDIGRWITWRVVFNLSTDTTKGYISVYKDGTLIGTFKGRTAIPGISSSYLKMGVYAQHGVHAQDTTTLISNLVFATV